MSSAARTSALGVVHLAHGRAPHRHDLVADELVEGALVLKTMSTMISKYSLSIETMFCGSAGAHSWT
jgi:hypothetical protein